MRDQEALPLTRDVTCMSLAGIVSDKLVLSPRQVALVIDSMQTLSNITGLSAGFYHMQGAFCEHKLCRYYLIARKLSCM